MTTQQWDRNSLASISTAITFIWRFFTFLQILNGDLQAQSCLLTSRLDVTHGRDSGVNNAESRVLHIGSNIFWTLLTNMIRVSVLSNIKHCRSLPCSSDVPCSSSWPVRYIFLITSSLSPSLVWRVSWPQGLYDVKYINMLTTSCCLLSSVVRSADLSISKSFNNPWLGVFCVLWRWMERMGAWCWVSCHK